MVNKHVKGESEPQGKREPKVYNDNLKAAVESDPLQSTAELK